MCESLGRRGSLSFPIQWRLLLRECCASGGAFVCAALDWLACLLALKDGIFGVCWMLMPMGMMIVWMRVMMVVVGSGWGPSFSVAFRMHATVADADLLRVNES
jgi:hypothetical protein